MSLPAPLPAAALPDDPFVYLQQQQEREEEQLEHEYLQRRVKELEQQLREFSALSTACQARQLDLALLLVLGHLQRTTCLQAHESFMPSTLARALNLDSLRVNDTIAQAWNARLIEREKAWTGSWHRIVLTAQGKNRLQELRQTFEKTGRRQELLILHQP